MSTGRLLMLAACVGALLATPVPGAAAEIMIESGALTAEELMRRYTRIVFAQAGTIEETARRLDLDRRTVKARLA